MTEHIFFFRGLIIRNNYISAILQQRTGKLLERPGVLCFAQGLTVMEEIQCICWTDNEKYESLGLFY